MVCVGGNRRQPWQLGLPAAGRRFFTHCLAGIAYCRHLAPISDPIEQVSKSGDVWFRSGGMWFTSAGDRRPAATDRRHRKTAGWPRLCPGVLLRIKTPRCVPLGKLDCLKLQFRNRVENRLNRVLISLRLNIGIIDRDLIHLIYVVETILA